MTQPRKIAPGEYRLSTRRTVERQYLLKPDEVVNQIIEYALAEAAQFTGLRLIAYVVMSNHTHLLSCDVQGRIPAFYHRFHGHVGKALNVYWNHEEAVWAPGRTCSTPVLTQEALLEKAAYILVNPIRAGLVARATDWPGVSSINQMPGQRKVVKRPKVFFDEEGDMPEEVVLETFAPDGFTDEGWAAALRERVAKVERSEDEERNRTGRRVLGRKAVLRQSHLDRPATKGVQRKRVPQVSCGDTRLRIQAIQALRSFRLLYAKALEKFRAGEREVVFPPGTWLMVQRYGVRVAPS